MRIKKIYQGSILANKILNSHSTSQTDTYSCEKINEMTEEVYSTEEVVIGKWQNKPLYKKTIFYNEAITAGVYAEIGYLSQNIKDVLEITYTLTSSNKDSVFFNFIDGKSESLEVQVFKTTGKVLVRSIGENWSSPDLFVTVKYTKTTD